MTFLEQQLHSVCIESDVVGGSIMFFFNSMQLRSLVLSREWNGNMSSLQVRQYQVSVVWVNSLNVALVSPVHFRWKNLSQLSQHILFWFEFRINLMLHLAQWVLALQLPS